MIYKVAHKQCDKFMYLLEKGKKLLREKPNTKHPCIKEIANPPKLSTNCIKNLW